MKKSESDSARKARQKAIRFLTTRDRTRYEMQQYLARSGFRKNEIDEVLEWVTELGYLDDARCAKNWVEYRNRFRPTGNYLLRLELEKKGICDDIINEVLNDKDKEMSLAKEVVEKGYRALKDSPLDKCYRKLGSLLQRRGFSWEITRKVLADVLPHLLDTDL
ncbi:MAG: regulatory protein RecX [Firmicutes bacterium]|nr:regulatory protein RecX [Bacillota bacterium]